MDTINYNTIKRMAKEQGVKVDDLIALARQNDPFYMGTRSNRVWGEWFADIFNRYGYGHGVHLRRIHYAVAMQATDVLMPNGQPYHNTGKCWSKISAASKYARYLNLVDPELFVDRRTVDATNYGNGDYDDEPEIQILTREWQANLALPDFPRTPNYHLANFHGNQRYHLEIWCEKSTMNDILEPVAEEYGATLQIGVGEMSITRTLDLVNRLAQADKPARIFYVSDFDPAGQSMPVAVSRKIEYFNQELELELDVKLFPCMLTEEQILTYNLPRKPIKSTERRKDSFESRYGVGATELDALEALHPGLMARILRSELDRYYDHDLYWRVSQAKDDIYSELNQAADFVLSDVEDEIDELREEYEAIKKEMATRLASYNKRRAEVWQAIRDDLAVDVPELDLDVPEADYAKERPQALFDSERDYFEQLDSYKEFQRKAGS